MTNKKWEALQLQIKALQQSNVTNSILNYQIFPNWNVFKQMDTFQTVDDIYSIVRKLAINSAMVPFYAFNKKTEEYLPDSDKLSMFCDSLDFETKEIMYTYLYYSGEIFMYKNRLELGVNKGQISLSILNPARMVVVVSQTFPVEIIGYRYQDTANGIEFEIDVEDIIYIKYFNPSVSNSNEHRGLSPITVLTRRLTRIQASEDATVAQMQNGGVPGIVYDKSPNLAPDVIGNRRDNFGKFIRNSANKGAPYFSANDLGYIALGTPLADMDVLNLENVDFDKLCNAFGISSVLFNNKKASTESNVQEMVKEMYTNTILPNIYRIEGALNKGITPELNAAGVIQCDVTEIKALKEDTTKQAQALNTMWWLTGNERREAMEYESSDEPLMDEIIIPSGMMLITDLNIDVKPVQNTAGDYNQAQVVPLRQANG